jgi:hypothetical protein
MELSQINAGPAPTTPAPEPAPAEAVLAPAPPALSKGALVVHVAEGQDRKIVQTGVVLEVMENDRVVVGWFASFSGPCATSELQEL